MRPPTQEDAAHVAALTNAAAPEPWTVERVLHEWSSPNLDVARDVRIDGDGYAAVFLEGERIYVDLQGEPTERLVAWAEEHGRELGVQRALAGHWAGADAVARALEAAAYRPVRHAYRMRIALEDPPPPPKWPDAVTVRTFRNGDEHVFYETQQETFEDAWEYVRETFDEWRHELFDSPAFSPELWFVAESDGEVAGIAICHPHPSVAGLGWIAVIGVRRPWRRRGLGRALLLHAFAQLRAGGFREAGLGVDAKSLTGANRLYESAGMRVAARFDFYEKRL